MIEKLTNLLSEDIISLFFFSISKELKPKQQSKRLGGGRVISIFKFSIIFATLERYLRLDDTLNSPRSMTASLPFPFSFCTGLLLCERASGGSGGGDDERDFFYSSSFLQCSLFS